MTLLHDRVRSLETADETLLQRRRAKRTCIQAGGIPSIEYGEGLLTEKEKNMAKPGEEVCREVC